MTLVGEQNRAEHARLVAELRSGSHMRRSVAMNSPGNDT